MKFGRLAGSGVLDSHHDLIGLHPVKRSFSHCGSRRHLHAVEKTGLRRLGQWAFASHLDIEVTFGLNGTQSNHPHPGTGNHGRSEMSVELDDLGQPLGIGGLTMVVGLRQAVFCEGDTLTGRTEEGL